MRQQANYIRGQGLGTWLSERVLAENAGIGNSVTLADGSTALAEYLTTPKDIQKYVQSDGDLSTGRSKVVCVFVFDGSAYGKVNSGDILTFQGIKYSVSEPLFPQFVNNVCVSLACACWAP